jgi:hypothetical protein
MRHARELMRPRLTDWLSERTADCQKNQAGVTRARGAVVPDLRDLP